LFTTVPPEEPEEAQRWLSYAREDLATAKALVGGDEIPFRIACFHAQQAAEKAMTRLRVDSTDVKVMTARAASSCGTHQCVRVSKPQFHAIPTNGRLDDRSYRPQVTREARRGSIRLEWPTVQTTVQIRAESPSEGPPGEGSCPNGRSRRTDATRWMGAGARPVPVGLGPVGTTRSSGHLHGGLRGG
jgi:hypothetical protein